MKKEKARWYLHRQLFTLFEISDVWIGGFTNTENYIKWMDSGESGYENWAGNNPQSNQDTMIRLKGASGKWTDENPNTEKFFYICQKGRFLSALYKTNEMISSQFY